MSYIKDRNATLKEMLANAVHFGHYTNKWNPLMKKNIWGIRANVHILDLHKTLDELEIALDFLAQQKKQGKTVLLVSTKQQSIPALRALAEKTKQPFVTSKWIPGLLTNFGTVSQRIRELKKLKDMRDSGDMNKYKKKEISKFNKTIAKLENALGGVQDMSDLPDSIFVIDAVRDNIAVKEANVLGIPVVAFTDSNTDPTPIQYPITANDDAIKSIKYILSKVAEVL